MATVILNNITINYKVTGAGMPLVLIHGHPFDHTMWYPQVAALADTCKVITPDLRGYGKSTLPASGKTTFENYATDMLLLLDHLEVGQFHLAGLSMGGQIIMEMFRQAPGRIRSLIFADTFASLDTPEVKQGRYDAANRLEREGMDAYAEEVIYKMMRPEHVKSMPEAAEFVIKMMKATSTAGAATALRARAERIDYLSEVFPGIKIPSLVIVGRQDEFTPVAMARTMQQNLQNCKLVVIEDAGHMPNLEHPEEFNQAVLDFLAGVE
ncbi:alpha/beta fold hydrolase [Mucilaginibacter gotjawali]|uniref:3-oxoadipate enol-lactonase 2 n=2 Tax=Mucilaginibacter gotjawali TaxID=1550579 RepID=A0A0X8X2D2_9SPHI|nr:alpha/beta hydrolase [Mucilaginibacter gotjawali]MBB3053622.1 pimeloyl-ACP methyl ester carboxylesterase [Mucilaginibacter gotjawali]BAU53882.1 3-oxoadipate enol-lactonase 2 [Mucilaginibacter gotjawali]